MNTTRHFSPFLKFLPLLIIYVILCIIKQKSSLVGDEGRYVLYADNLLNGFYASNIEQEYTFLWNGPGYPIFLTIFRYFNLPFIVPKLFNAVLIYIGIVFFYKTLKLFISLKKSFVVSLILGLYYPFLVESIPKLLTEALSFFLICYLVYNITIYFDKGMNKYKWHISIALGCLILTKIFFVYVIIAMIIGIPFLLYKRGKQTVKKYFIILAIGFCFSIPYQAYTYSITNRLFYFSNSGGMSLYWMSTPFENEFGDWHFFRTLHNKPQLYKNHAKFIDSIKDLPPVEKDIALKTKAINNITNNKYKFFKNWQSNVGRLFFNYPYSIPSSSNSVLFLFIPNSIIVILLIISFILSLKNYKKLKSSIYFFSIFTVVYLGGISLLSCYPRFLYIMFPVILIWISYSLQEFLIIKMK